MLATRNCPCSSNLCCNGLFSLGLIGSAVFGATFNLVARVGLPLIFETLKDGNFQIDNLASNNCFDYKNVFQNCLLKGVLHPWALFLKTL